MRMQEQTGVADVGRRTGAVLLCFPSFLRQNPANGPMQVKAKPSASHIHQVLAPSVYRRISEFFVLEDMLTAEQPWRNTDQRSMLLTTAKTGFSLAALGMRLCRSGAVPLCASAPLSGGKISAAPRWWLAMCQVRKRYLCSVQCAGWMCAFGLVYGTRLGCEGISITSSPRDTLAFCSSTGLHVPGHVLRHKRSDRSDHQLYNQTPTAKSSAANCIDRRPPLAFELPHPLRTALDGSPPHCTSIRERRSKAIAASPRPQRVAAYLYQKGFITPKPVVCVWLTSPPLTLSTRWKKA